MKFNYPRELSFAHPDYQVACSGTETPFTGRNSKTYLMVWNKKLWRHEYYCFEDDLFLPNDEYNLIDQIP